MSQEYLNALSIGSRLNEYTIDDVLGAGGFGITYLVTDVNLNRKFVIKEYFPTDIAVRQDQISIQPKTSRQQTIYQQGIDRFLKEAQNLAAFDHPNIVKVNRFFQANETAYFVMEYAEGNSLEFHLRTKNRPLAQDELLDIINPILDALKVIHKTGLFHRDIKPGNILLTKNGIPVLIDFGAARYALSQASQNPTAVLTPGYAPFEQYHESSVKQGPWTDIYAIGATMYRCITGADPLPSVTRAGARIDGEQDPLVPISDYMTGKDYNKLVLQAIDWALRIKTLDRPQDVEHFQEVLKGRLRIPPPIETAAAVIHPSPSPIHDDTVVFTPSGSSPDESEIVTVAPHKSTPRNDSGSNATVVVQSTPPPPPKSPKPPSGKKSSWPILIIAVVVIAVLVLAVTQFVRYQKIQTMLKDADILLANGRYRQSYDAYMDVLDFDDDNDRALNGMKTARKSEIDGLLGKARDHIRAGRLTKPPGNNAQSSYQEILKLDSDHLDAKNGIRQIPVFFQQRGDSLKSGKSWQAAIEAYEEALSLGTGDSILVAEDVRNDLDYCRIQLIGQGVQLIRTISDAADINCVEFSPNGSLIATGSDDNRTVKLWNSSSGSLVRTLIKHEGYIWTVAFSPDGQLVASGAGDNIIKIWKVSTGQLLYTLTDHSGAVYSLAFSPDGSKLISGSADNSIKVWNSTNGYLIRTLYGHSGSVYALAYSPDGNTIASGAYDNTIKLWNASNYQLRRTINTGSGVYGLAFSPNGQIIAVGCDDNNVRTYNVSSGNRIDTMSGHTGSVRSVKFSPDGNWLVSSGSDNKIKVWEVSNGTLIKTLHGHTATVRSVTFSPDGRLLASGSYDDKIKIWGPFK